MESKNDSADQPLGTQIVILGAVNGLLRGRIVRLKIVIGLLFIALVMTSSALVYMCTR